MKMKSLAIALASTICFASGVLAADGPKTPEEFAKAYMAAINSKDKAALDKLRYPLKGKSAMQEMMDAMSEADLGAGTQYTKYEILKPEPGMDKPLMGPDGLMYIPNLPVTNVIKITSETANSKSSTSFPIGIKDGVYYQCAIGQAEGETVPFQFGWNRFTPPKSTWSIMLPNEPEPGLAALEKMGGKPVAEDADAYGVVRNTASIKTTQHWFRCGEEGKRINDDGNKAVYRIACTTYEPETLKEWFADPAKNLSDAVDSSVRREEGKLIQQKDIQLSGAPGKEYEIQEKDGTICVGRVYWIKDALYELTVESKAGKPNVEIANKFLDSLQVN
ncbi:MAG: hypothetical protein K2Y22_15740 [Candidatus Obscuribacterales bacterium]|nr:hypothetical protein [Candidatus Obscuribacterales bacterium]